ncbi:DNA polymerase III subunit psi [Candidatus Erwinia haradaeae]|uniref:DNA polymerase III subunit psi n=1 Tax=Candidatus Erwinia haradaeae TaxID=1922217 RepID=A0A451D2A4_9GAMM|nr:DNA polymerase III subunit psi [Candidatus Erwinia haradaeae]VFP79749.1 DNA polymerase III subunit psi [Candidatus Erwinia haradaeae]
MFDRRDFLLHKIGIMQYIPRRAYAIQDQMEIKSIADIRLIIVSDILLSLTDPLVSDILCTLHLNARQVRNFTVQNLEVLSSYIHCCYGWFLGVSVPKMFTGIQIISPSLPKLYKSLDAKKQLWKQIYTYQLDTICLAR